MSTPRSAVFQCACGRLYWRPINAPADRQACRSCRDAAETLAGMRDEPRTFPPGSQAQTNTTPDNPTAQNPRPKTHAPKDQDALDAASILTSMSEAARDKARNQDELNAAAQAAQALLQMSQDDRTSSSQAQNQSSPSSDATRSEDGTESEHRTESDEPEGKEPDHNEPGSPQPESNNTESSETRSYETESFHPDSNDSGSDGCN